MTARHPGSPFWVPSAALQRHLNRTATGRDDCDWLTYVRAVHLPARVPRTLVLGCGNGFLERALARYEGIGEILATDGEPASVETASKVARREGLSSITHARFEPGGDPFPDGPWNLVMAHDFLHHVPNAESLLRAVRAALTPGGRFVFSEYTGPPRFQHDDVAMELVERYFRVLPDHIRTEPDTGRILWRPERIDAARLGRESPHEAAASETLLPLARRLFGVDAELSGGGGLLHPLLSRLARNFRPGSAEDERLIEVLCTAEERAASLRTVSPLFTIFVGRRPA
jgi:SAM-dependent methyltransferase